MSIKDEWNNRAIEMGASKRAVLFKRFPSFLNNRIHKQHIAFIKNHIKSNNITSCLDVGCGYGRISQELKTLMPDVDFQGIELSSEFSDIYRENIGPCFCGLAQEFESIKKFDLIIVTTLLMYLNSDEREHLIANLKAMVSDQGAIVVIEPALEFQALWRSLSRSRNANATGGNVQYFSRQELTTILSDTDYKFDYQPINISWPIPPVHHAFFARRTSNSTNTEGYQYDYTNNIVAQKNMYNKGARQQKSEKIVSVLEDYLGRIRDKATLEISCSAGYMSIHFSENFYHVDAIDIDEDAINHAKEINPRGNISYHTMDALNMSFEENSYDIVICNQMYEHVPDADRLMDEIYRVLRPGGICFFGATNRHKIVETHYGRIPFLSWIPKPLAHNYLKLLGKGDFYYETLLSYRKLRKLTQKFDRIDYTEKTIRSPEKYCATDMVRPGSTIQKLSIIFLKSFYFLSPGYIWLLQKPKN
ncbi:MAG: methyltransferase domain-containing protein [Pseudomonadales bacterium]|nr:methyltransferase domain-containing protein [Pseudomonadales bacterium]